MMELWNEFDRLVVFDTETTGIEFGTDRIIEIGAAALENGEEQGSFNALIRLPAGQTLPPFITQLTGITDEQLRDEGGGRPHGSGGVLPPAGRRGAAAAGGLQRPV